MEQTKIDILLSSIRTLNKTEFNENLTEENNWENILLELEMLQKTVSDQKRRSKVIIKTILVKINNYLLQQKIWDIQKGVLKPYVVELKWDCLKNMIMYYIFIQIFLL